VQRAREEHGDQSDMGGQEFGTAAAAANRLALRCHLTLQQPMGSPVFDIDQVIGIDLDPSGPEARTRHALYVSSIYVVPAHREPPHTSEEIPGLMEVTYHLTTLRWRDRAEEPDRG